MLDILIVFFQIHKLIFNKNFRSVSVFPNVFVKCFFPQQKSLMNLLNRNDELSLIIIKPNKFVTLMIILSIFKNEKSESFLFQYLSLFLISICGVWSLIEYWQSKCQMSFIFLTDEVNADRFYFCIFELLTVTLFAIFKFF